jgi:hypothetical protein
MESLLETGIGPELSQVERVEAVADISGAGDHCTQL